MAYEFLAKFGLPIDGMLTLLQKFWEILCLRHPAEIQMINLLSHFAYLLFVVLGFFGYFLLLVSPLAIIKVKNLYFFLLSRNSIFYEKNNKSRKISMFSLSCLLLERTIKIKNYCSFKVYAE